MAKKSNPLSEQEVWNQATALVEEHGREAVRLAVRQAIDAKKARDAQGDYDWMRIAVAAEELTRDRYCGEAEH